MESYAWFRMSTAINNNKRCEVHLINWPFNIQFLNSGLAIDRQPLILKWGGHLEAVSVANSDADNVRLGSDWEEVWGAMFWFQCCPQVDSRPWPRRARKGSLLSSMVYSNVLLSEWDYSRMPSKQEEREGKMAPARGSDLVAAWSMCSRFPPFSLEFCFGEQNVYWLVVFPQGRWGHTLAFSLKQGKNEMLVLEGCAHSLPELFVPSVRGYWAPARYSVGWRDIACQPTDVLEGDRKI